MISIVSPTATFLHTYADEEIMLLNNIVNKSSLPLWRAQINVI